MTQIIAVVHTAGGVSKTTLTHNLGYHLACPPKKGKGKGKGNREVVNKVLLVDLDTNASLTNFVGLAEEDLDKTVYESIVLEEPLPIYNLDYFDIAPTSINLSAAEIELAKVSDRNSRLKNAIANVKLNYDYILIDCPASFGILSNLALTAANAVLIPVKTQHKSFIALTKMFEVIALVRKSVNRDLRICGFVPTMYNASASQDKRTLQGMKDQLSDHATVFPPIKQATAIADASEQSVPLAIYSKNHPMVKVFDQISGTIIGNSGDAI